MQTIHVKASMNCPRWTTIEYQLFYAAHRSLVDIEFHVVDNHKQVIDIYGREDHVREYYTLLQQVLDFTREGVTCIKWEEV